MTDNDKKIIMESIRKYREIASQAVLQIEALSALLPKRRKEQSKGYITAPDGEKLIYNKKLYKKYEAGRRGVTIMTGGKHG